MARRKGQHPISDAEAAAMAEEWLKPLSWGKGTLSYKAVANFARKEFQKEIVPATAERAIKRAFEKRLVRLVPRHIVADYSRNKGLEDALYKKWKMQFIVVETGLDDDKSDEIHAQIGDAMAKYISEFPDFISDDERIGIGSGRAIHYFIRSMREADKKIIVKNPTVVSMTGSIYPKAENRDLNLILDADSNVVNFIECFDSRTEVLLINSHIAYQNLEYERKMRWLSIIDEIIFPINLENDELKKQIIQSRIPSQAYFGVGIFGPNHRMFDFMNDDRMKIFLSPVIKSLNELKNFREEIANSKDMGYHEPIGDICNRLFLIYVDESINKNKRSIDIVNIEKINERIEKMEKTVDVVNAKLMTPSKTLLSYIGKNILIAGTKKKSQAIKSLLYRKFENDGRYGSKVYVPFKLICTDQRVAQDLLHDDF